MPAALSNSDRMIRLHRIQIASKVVGGRWYDSEAWGVSWGLKVDQDDDDDVSARIVDHIL